MAPQEPEQNLFNIYLKPSQDNLKIDIEQVKENGLEVERFSERNRILDHLDATHRFDVMKQFYQCVQRLQQQSINRTRLSYFQILCLKKLLSVPDKNERTNKHSLANIYCSVLTNKKWQNYSEELPLKDIQCSDPDIAHDILGIMTEYSTTSINDVFLHPFYWNNFKKICFICDAFEFIKSKVENLKEVKKMSILQHFNMHEVSDVIPDKGWIVSLELTSEEIRYFSENKDLQIEKNVISKLARKGAHENSMYELMRFFRYRYIHHLEDMDDTKIAFGGYPSGFLRFFTARFPKFFMHIYRNIKINPELHTIFKRYFLDDLKTEGEPVEEASPDVLPSINQRWTHIEGTDIKYDQASRYKKGSKVFNALRIEGDIEQETVVKFVTDFNHGDREFIQKFKREIDNHWDTHIHDNVVRYLQSGDCKYKTKDAFFILMEKCDRKTLFERIREGNMPNYERAKTVEYIAKGLQHLKKRNILPRDIKPQNILYRGHFGVILDLGLSKKIPQNKSHTFHSSEFVEPLGWGAPETYSYNAEFSFAANIYSAGLLFYFTLTNGKHPYGDNPRSWQTYINDDENGEKCNLKPLYDNPDGIAAYDLISLMLSRNSEDRPTIEEVLKHPFLWNVTKKRNFYYDICRTIEFHRETKNESRIFSSQSTQYLNEVETDIKNWKDELLLTDAEEKNMKDNCEKRNFGKITVFQKDVMKNFAKKIPDSVTSMVRFIRNRLTHSAEDKREGKIDLTDEQLWEFFNSRYPYLFIYTYYASKGYNETKPASDPDDLDKYFEKEDQFPTMEQPFRDAGKGDEYTTELDVKRSRRDVSNLTTLDKSLHSSETEGEPVRKASRDVLPSKKTYIGESSGTTSHKEIRTRFFDVAKPPEDTQQDQLPANEQLFRDAGKSDEYTTELSVKGSRREVGNLSTLDKSLHSSETEGEPVRKSSLDVLPSNETPTCQSKSVIIRYEKDDCTSNVEIFKIENIINSYSEVDMIEFCDCKVGNDYYTPEERGQKRTAKCKISKLIISYTDHFKEFSRFFYSTFGGCEIKSLCLVYANLDDQDVEKLQSFMVKGIENLDISYNKKITRDGFERIGKMIADQGTLRAIDCDLGEMKFEKLWEGLKNVNLRELDIGYNSKLAEGGFEMLAKLVASRGITTLKLRGCQITEKTIQVFYNKLKVADENVMLNELDVSYNRKMNSAGCKVLGLIMNKFRVTTLNLAGCQISEEHLTSLMSIKDIELHALNLRDNSYPGNIMVEIANIVSEFKIQELDISECMFSVSELMTFRTNLNGTKMQKLHLGDKRCELGMEYIQEVCQLLPTVKEMLYLRFHRLDDSCRHLLKEQSEKLSVSIQLCDEPEANGLMTEAHNKQTYKKQSKTFEWKLV